MRKITDIIIVCSVLLLICICIPQHVNAQKLKPGVKDINKAGVSKSVTKKQGISSSVKSKLPALEVSRLSLDSGCKITGYIQNKGAKMDASHPDFPKLQIKIGYTFDNKTEFALLETRPGATAAQPKLLMSYPDMNNFANGRPAKFVSKLQVPATGKGYAVVFAEADPNNLIRETPEGERKKRVQARLKSGCIAKEKKAIHVKLKNKNIINKPEFKGQGLKIDPATKENVNVSPTSKISSGKMVTKDRAPWVLAPTDDQHIGRGENISVEWVSPFRISVISANYKLLVYGPSDNLIKEQYLDVASACETIPCSFSDEGGHVQFPRWVIPGWVLYYSSYIIQVEVHGEGDVTLIGQSGRFTMDGRATTDEEDRAALGPITDRIRITSPERGNIINRERYTAINVQYELLISDVPEDARIYFTLKKTDTAETTRAEIIENAPFDGSIDMVLDILPPEGYYKIYTRVIDSAGNLLATGNSGLFAILSKRYSNTEGGLEITSPGNMTVCAPHQDIIVRYNFNGCTAVLENATVKISRRMPSGRPEHIDLYNGPLDPDGEMRFRIPPQCIISPYVFWNINIAACTGEPDGDCSPVATGNCRAASDSFILNYCSGEGDR